MTFNREQFLEAVLASAVDYAVIAMDPKGRVTSWNEGAVRILGWTEAEVLGQPAAIFFTEDDRSKGTPQREMEVSLDQGRGMDERWHLRKDGSTFWANGEMMPLRAKDGVHLGFVKILRDRTEQRLAAEKQRTDAEFLRGVLASSPDCIKVLDLEGRLSFMTEGGQHVMEVSDFNEILGCPWPDFWKGQGNLDAHAALAAAQAGGIGRFVGEANTMKNKPKWWDVIVSPMPGPDGKPEKLLCVSRDITATRKAEEQSRLLGEELQHRVKNTLAMVQAIIRQTLRNSPSFDAAQRSLEQRVAALGRAHGMLTSGGWTSSDLHSIIESALDLHESRSDCFKVEGPRAYLQAQATTSLALLLHELGTNAIKYGALSVDEGWVEITWTVKPEPGYPENSHRLELIWRERGGPPVTPPAQRGFGSRLIERALASTLKGEAVISFLNEGVVCTVTCMVEMSAH